MKKKNSIAIKTRVSIYFLLAGGCFTCALVFLLTGMSVILGVLDAVVGLFLVSLGVSVLDDLVEKK